MAEDFDLWLQAAKNSDLNYLVIEKPLYWYRVIENVTVEKMIQSYNTQIEVINSSYTGIVSISKKNRIIRKFKLKKSVVRCLDFFSLMSFLLKRRSDGYKEHDIKDYRENYLKIKNMRLQ